MPLKLKVRNTPPPSAPPEDQSFMERIGGLPGLAAGGVRALTGVASAGGFLPGALISGAGELGAEALEGSLFKQDPLRTAARVGAAGTIGLIPFGAVLKAGRPLASAVRGAAYSGGGEALREAAAGQDVDTGTVLKSAATGGALIGGISGLMKMLGISGKAAGQVKAPSVAPAPYGPKSLKDLAQETVAARTAKFPTRQAHEAERLKEQAEIAWSKKTLAYDKAKEAAQLAQDKESVKNLAAFLKDKQKAKDLAARRTENQTKLDRILTAVEEGKMTPGKPAIATSLSAQTEEGGRLGMRTPFKPPKKGGGGVAPGAPGKAPGGAPSAPEGPSGPPPEVSSIFNPPRMAAAPQPPPAAPAPAVPSVLSTVPSVPAATAVGEAPRAVPAFDWPGVGKMYTVVGGPSDRSTVTAAKLVELGIPVPEEAVVAAAAPSSPLARFFKSRLEAAGEHYGGVKAARVAGEAVPEEGRALAGRLAQQERIAAGQPAPPRTPTLHPEATATYAPEELADYAQRAGKLDELANLLRGQAKGPRGGETGEITPLLMARLGLGAGGALVGAAWDPLDNPLLSAVAGGAAGALLPSAVPMLRSMGARPEALEGLDRAVTSPEGIKEATKRIYHSLPQIQRFNYLANFHGLIANSMFGPYGSAMMAGIERGLSGDPRGWALVRSLNPAKFAKDVWASRPEARKLIEAGEIGREANIRVGPGAPLPQRLLGGPGVWMTSGDVTARKYITAAGFTDDEARIMTLTSEPELPAAKTVANLGKTSTLMNILAPFRRTPANIAEQGAMRLPVIGSMVQSQRAVPDPLKQQLWQQILSTGVAGTSGTISSQLDPETAKIARRYVTNLGGQYSLPAALGWAAGQAVAQGKPVVSAQNLRPAMEALPLPTADPLEAWARFILGDAQGKHPLPPGALPSQLKSRFLPSVPGLLEKTPSTALPRLRGLPRIRRQR